MLVICRGVIIKVGHGGVSPYGLILNLFEMENCFEKLTFRVWRVLREVDKELNKFLKVEIFFRAAGVAQREANRCLFFLERGFSGSLDLFYQLIPFDLKKSCDGI
jgi:hypothetical protein